ncbi:hypothetical protein D3C78_1449370 [compost metagenome]
MPKNRINTEIRDFDQANILVDELGGSFTEGHLHEDDQKELCLLLKSSKRNGRSIRKRNIEVSSVAARFQAHL